MNWVGFDKLTRSEVAILDPPALYSDSGTYSQQIKYFQVPVTIKYRFKNHIFINAGSQFALRTKAKLRFVGKKDNKTVEINTDNSDLLTRLEVGIMTGVGYKLKQGKGMNEHRDIVFLINRRD